MRDMVNNELYRLLSEDIIEPVQYLDWAAPVVLMKAGKSIPLYGDYKLTVNQVETLEMYPNSPNGRSICPTGISLHVQATAVQCIINTRDFPMRCGLSEKAYQTQWRT